MKGNKSFGCQLDILLSGGADMGIQHLDEMEKDLLQTEILLKEAISKLSSSFLEIHDAVRQQQELVRLLAVEGGTADGNAEKLAQLENDIERHVDSAVTGLQFEDMTNQLIGRALSRIDGLRKMLCLVSSAGSAVAKQSACEGAGEILENMSKDLSIRSQELHGRLASSVLQQHAESGSVELF